MEWNLDWVGKVRKLAAAACNFYISQYYSSASLERREHGWRARFYYATYYVDVINDHERTLTIKIWILPEERITEYKECEVEGNLEV